MPLLMPLLLFTVYLGLGVLAVGAGLLCAACGGTVGGRSNCVLYAVSRFYYEGGWVLVRKSTHGFWPHFLYTPDGVTISEFRPVPRLTARRHRFPPLIFEGTVHVSTWPPTTGT